MEDYSRVALEIKDPQTIFDFETVMLICFFQKKMEELSSYRMSCEKDAGYACCPGWSLPNYIATYSNKTDCAQLQVSQHKFRLQIEQLFFIVNSKLVIKELICLHLGSAHSQIQKRSFIMPQLLPAAVINQGK